LEVVALAEYQILLKAQMAMIQYLALLLLRGVAAVVVVDTQAQVLMVMVFQEALAAVLGGQIIQALLELGHQVKVEMVEILGQLMVQAISLAAVAVALPLLAGMVAVHQVQVVMVELAQHQAFQVRL
jgi:hypothetical protein